MRSFIAVIALAAIASAAAPSGKLDFIAALNSRATW